MSRKAPSAAPEPATLGCQQKHPASGPRRWSRTNENPKIIHPMAPTPSSPELPRERKAWSGKRLLGRDLLGRSGGKKKIKIPESHHRLFPAAFQGPFRAAAVTGSGAAGKATPHPARCVQAAAPQPAAPCVPCPGASPYLCGPGSPLPNGPGRLALCPWVFPPWVQGAARPSPVLLFCVWGSTAGASLRCARPFPPGRMRSGAGGNRWEPGTKPGKSSPISCPVSCPILGFHHIVLSSLESPQPRANFAMSFPGHSLTPWHCENPQIVN